jgi:uncharacterized RDD family membrane protein YckC
MTSRFEPDPEAEDYDFSEQQFAASLEDKPRFIVEEPVIQERETVAAEPVVTEQAVPQIEQDAPSPVQPDLLSPPPNDSWREEVAARLNNYRSRRRPKAPKYPSLRLKFEEPAWTSNSPRSEGSLAPIPEAEPVKDVVRSTEPPVNVAPVETGKLLEFPRTVYAPPQMLDQLADPVFERPRILEAPEIVPPPPALGGIHIEAEEDVVEERRPGFDLPLQPAEMWRRWLASGIDGVIVLAAFAAFAAIFLRITAAELPWQQAASTSLGLLGIFWATYQYGMLVLTGSTPGLRLAKLQLSRFDGTPVPRSLRRLRVAAVLLSGLSLGLGYAWAFLDEDRLCWHDRITRTYMAPMNM